MKYKKELLLGLVFITVFALLFVILSNDQMILNLKIIVIGALISIILVFYLKNEIRKRREKRMNIPVEDEMSKKQKLAAGNKAFHTSLILWIIIFVFNDLFDKNETMLGIGILGSAIIYWIYLWIFKLKGSPDEE
jgi:Ca2+/Na+ antiporter